MGNIRNNINYGPCVTGVNIPAIESKYSVTYIGDFCVKAGGQWMNSPVSIFHQANPNVKLGHSNYLGVFVKDSGVYLTNGISAFSEPIRAAVARNGEIIYSRFRHDFRNSSDGSVSVDGGRDYTRTLFDGDIPLFVDLIIDGSELKVQHTIQEPFTSVV